MSSLLECSFSSTPSPTSHQFFVVYVVWMSVMCVSRVWTFVCRQFFSSNLVYSNSCNSLTNNWNSYRYITVEILLTGRNFWYLLSIRWSFCHCYLVNIRKCGEYLSRVFVCICESVCVCVLVVWVIIVSDNSEFRIYNSFFQFSFLLDVNREFWLCLWISRSTL